MSLDHCYSAASATSSVDGQGQFGGASSTIVNHSPVQSTTIPGGSRSTMSPKRRSQRQIDRQEMEQLKKIRAENEELLKKEKEKMNQAFQSSFPKKEDSENEPDTLLSDSNVPVEPAVTQPVSRLSAIRQELQQKILAVDPIKPKVPSVSHNLTKLVGGKQPTTPKVQTGKLAREVAEPTSVGKEVTIDKATQSSAVKTPQNNAIKTPTEPISTPPARPRRENRQPPKHLREAFNQLEFENVEKSVKRISRNPASLSGAENSSQESEDEGTAKDRLNGLDNSYQLIIHSNFSFSQNPKRPKTMMNLEKIQTRMILKNYGVFVASLTATGS